MVPSDTDFVFPDPGVPRLAIERIDDIDSEQAARCIAEARPFVTRVKWPTLGWTPEYIREKVGKVPVETWKKTGEKVGMSLDEFLTLVDDPARHARDYVIHNYPVMKLWDWFGPQEPYRPLIDDVPLPAFIDPKRISGMYVWVRNTGYYDNKSHCESNACAAINLQVRGKKHVWLFPPQDARLLGVDLTRADLMLPAFFSTEQSVYHPSDEHPEFEDARCYEAVLEPGDAVHIPAFWYHWFVHYNVYQMNLNCWFAPPAMQLHEVSAQWAYLNALSVALGDQAHLQERFEQLPAATQELLTEIARLLIHDPRCTDQMKWRELARQRTQQTLAARVFTEKTTDE